MRAEELSDRLAGFSSPPDAILITTSILPLRRNDQHLSGFLRWKSLLDKSSSDHSRLECVGRHPATSTREMKTYVISSLLRTILTRKKLYTD
ncbi:hypothetical protein Pmani_038280 [Petrolisthes manimaculis]|uniref:Uncharacterized protein n=1 Tax=Petrolisthes manimaculis TaxID=1843537 RepID=A0AAE1NGJ4_9EUCA|nr:hypothetical protein Pmani_038280 [Petrolisthes manimaculis]